jgi:hydrogenase expression/formation protein HypC
MCLAVPMRIVSIKGDRAIAESRGVQSTVNTYLVPDVEVNDWVIIHAGFIIEKLDAEEADRIDEIWSEYERFLDEE